MKKLTTILLALFTIAGFSQNTYYVSTTGNNGDDGLTEGNAWETLIYAEANATTAGDIIALEKGNTWSIDNVIDISHGGTEADPIVWDGSLWGAGANAIIQANSAGGASPKYYSLVHIAGCDYVTFQNITVDVNGYDGRYGIVIGGSSGSMGPTAQNDERNIIIQNCEVLDVGDQSSYQIGILVSTWNNDMYDITVQRCTVDGTDAHGIAYYMGKTQDGATSSELHGGYIGYNTVTNYRRYGGVGVGINIVNKVTDVIVEHNTVTTGVDGNGLAFAYEHNDSDADYFPTGCIIRWNDFRVKDGEAWCFLIQSGGAMTADIYGNIIINETDEGPAYSGGVVFSNGGNPGWAGADFNLYFNDIICDGGHSVKNEIPTTGHVTLKNNILTNRGTANTCSCLWSSAIAGATTADYNFYDRIGGVGTVPWVIDNATWYQTDDANPITDYDANAVTGDPVFVTEFTDLHLQPSSPAIKAGVAIDGITQDYDGRNLASPPDIGAYKFGYMVVVPMSGDRVFIRNGRVVVRY